MGAAKVARSAALIGEIVSSLHYGNASFIKCLSPFVQRWRSEETLGKHGREKGEKIGANARSVVGHRSNRKPGAAAA